MLYSTRKALTVAAVALSLAGLATTSFADTAWQKHHPRRVEVNHRLAHINRSIRRERREGELSAYQARRMHERAHVIRLQERQFARHHGGHISRREQARLNHEATVLHRHAPG